MKIINIETHAFFRMLERGQRCGLDYIETKERVFSTVRSGRFARKHFSKRHKTYYSYFSDNLSFYVICLERGSKILIKTVIIEEGKE
jgi:hypothetical protein